MKVKNNIELVYEPTNQFVVVHTLHENCKGCAKAASSAEIGARASGSLGCTEIREKRIGGRSFLSHSAKVKRVFTAEVKKGEGKND